MGRLFKIYWNFVCLLALQKRGGGFSWRTMGRQQNEKILPWNMGKHHLRGMGDVAKSLRNFSCMAFPYRNFWTHLCEYMVHAWLDLVTKLQRYTHLVQSWSTGEECKKWDAVCISNQGSDKNRMERHWTGKAGMCFRGLLSKVLRRLSQFYEIQSGGWPREVLHMT